MSYDNKFTYKPTQKLKLKSSLTTCAEKTPYIINDGQISQIFI